MRAFKTKEFARFARKERIPDQALCEAIARARGGLVDADLGGGVIKQRVSRRGGGRSGGYRTIIAYRDGDRAVYLHGFAKSDRDNLDDGELKALKAAAAVVLALDDAKIAKAVRDGKWIEVDCDD